MIRMFLKDEKWIFLYVILVSIMFGCFFVLMDVSIWLVLYGCILVYSFTFVFVVIQFFHYKNRYENTKLFQKNTCQDVSLLPEYSRSLECLLSEIIREEVKNQKKMISVTEQKYNDMMDYYTIWAHQIKTPIAAMYLQLQQDESNEARSIQLELMKIEQYVDMVLQYLRVDSNSTDYEFCSCSLDSMIRESIRKWAPLFIRKKITLEYDSTKETLITDEKWFEFILNQLLSNSLKYTNQGVITIQVKSNVLSIKDTGIGISEEDLPRIFEKGYTGLNGRMDKKATGIGLYLTHRVARKLGLELAVQSKVGEGTILTVSWDQKLTKM